MMDVRRKSIIYSQKGFAYNLKSKIWRQRRLGFTLIELLVVMSILAVLAGTIVMATNNARDKGKDARRKQDLQALSSALVAFYVDHRQYPPVDSITYPQLDYPSDSISHWIPELADYLPKIPKDPLQSSISTFFANAFGGLGKLANKGQVAGATDIKLGNENITPGSNSDTNYFNGSKFTTGPIGGQATSMSINAASIANPPNYQLVIYSDNSGVPGTLIAKTAGTETLIVGWNDATLTTSPTLMPNTSYWLMVSTNGASVVTKSTGGSSKWFANTNSFGTPPNPAPSANPEGDTYSIYATYTPDNNIYSATVSNGADDGKRVWPGDFPNGTFENTVRDTPQGTYYSCPTKRDNYFRFSNITIPPNATINSAYLTITPTTWQQSAIDQNQASIPNFKAELRAELAGNPAAITDDGSAPGHAADNFTSKVNNSLTSFSVAWPPVGQSIGIWNPLVPGANVSPDISSLIQPLVELGTWNSTNGHINLFWLDTGTGCDGLGNGSGRSGVSYEGQTLYSDGDAPRLTITWTPPAAPTPPIPTSSPAPTTGQCDKIGVFYCYRTSAAKKVFVLWSQLENTNDQDVVATDACANSNFLTGTYANLGKPTGSGLNFCIKSPPL